MKIEKTGQVILSDGNCYSISSVEWHVNEWYNDKFTFDRPHMPPFEIGKEKIVIIEFNDESSIIPNKRTKTLEEMIKELESHMKHNNMTMTMTIGVKNE